MIRKLRLRLLDGRNLEIPSKVRSAEREDRLSICTDYTPYGMITIEGEGAMLIPECIREATAAIRAKTKAPIILDTRMTDNLDDVLPLFDGLTLNLHTKDDVMAFHRLEVFSENLMNMAKRKLMRLNVFTEAGRVSCQEFWRVKRHMSEASSCARSRGEELMRYKNKRILFYERYPRVATSFFVGVAYSPVIMVRGGREYFVVNRVLKEQVHAYNPNLIEQRADLVPNMISALKKSKGLFCKFFGDYDDPRELLCSMKEAGRQFSAKQNLFSVSGVSDEHCDRRFEFQSNETDGIEPFCYYIYSEKFLASLQKEVEMLTEK